MKKETLYMKIADIIEKQIFNGTLKLGDKIPSIRILKQLHNVSINTIKQAYLELESKSLIESIPKTGYFVSKVSQRKLPLPTVALIDDSKGTKTRVDLITKVFDTLNNAEITQFSLGVPDPNLLPIQRLNKTLITVNSQLSNGGTNYQSAQGSQNLRNTIAKWSMFFNGSLTGDDFVTTSGAMNALYYCLSSVTKPGDTVAVESPVYFGILQLIKSLNLKVLEIPSHPNTGMDLNILQKSLSKIRACCVVSNFSNPLGSLMPVENKMALVSMLAEKDIPLIEDDLYGSLYFGSERPLPCKAFDENENVMYISAVSKTLAPGYRVGWVAAGKYKNEIIKRKLLTTISTPSLYEETIANFLDHGKYDHHLRSLRKTLNFNYLKYKDTIEQYFPEDTKISTPKGGYMLWLELNKNIDTAKLFDYAIQKNISFAPGRMFTQHNQYNNYLRLSFALEWNEKLKEELILLGELIKTSVS